MMDSGLNQMKPALAVCLVLTFCTAFSMLAFPQNEDTFLGVVQNGQLRLLTSANIHGPKVRLMPIPAQESALPETEALDLTSYESRLILVRGHRNNEWICSAAIVDVAGPELTRFILEYYFPGRLVINEVELNPSLQDLGNEWVELYNKSFVDEVSLAGWQLSYTSYCEADAPCECWQPLPRDVTIGPGEYYVFPFDKLRLNNENGWPICLKDAAGITVDATPQGLKDDANDDRTWQRIPNAQDTDSRPDWDFRISTRDTTNP